MLRLPSKKAAPGAMVNGRGESREAVTPSFRLAFGFMSARARALGARIARGRFLLWRRKDPAELERLRRLDVNRRGRISAGRVVDLVEAEAAGSKSYLVVYSYEVAGVTSKLLRTFRRCPKSRRSPTLRPAARPASNLIPNGLEIPLSPARSGAGWKTGNRE